MRRSQILTLIAVFATLSIICDSIVGIPQLSSGVWYGWIFLMEPISGIILGPYAGFLSILIGVMIGHSIYLRGEAPMYEYLFTLGAPFGAMISGFIYKGRWKGVFIYYTLLLMAYILTPISWELPLWGLWNVYLAFIILCLFIIILNGWRIGNRELRKPSHLYALSAFIGLEADILFRIFILIPCQTYRMLYGFTTEVLQVIWAAGALVTPIQVGLSIIMNVSIGPILIRILSSRGWLLNIYDS